MSQSKVIELTAHRLLVFADCMGLYTKEGVPIAVIFPNGTTRFNNDLDYGNEILIKIDSIINAYEIIENSIRYEIETSNN